MATRSVSPPNATDEKPQNPGPGAETVQPTITNQQNAGEDSVKESSPTSVFVNSQPLREEQVLNAVKFLSHPKVRGSPVMYRRSFLERKGLTKEEIDEAFQRVPDPLPSAQTTVVNQDGQLKQAPNVQQQVQPQSLQPTASAATGATTLSHSRFHWSHALIAIGLLAASGAGTAVLIKKSILPWLKSWMRKVVLEEDNEQLKRTDLKPTLAEEAAQAAQAAKAAAAAAADVAKTSQEMLISRNDDRRYFEEFANLLNKQVQEMKTMTNVIRNLEGQTMASRGGYLSEQDNRLVQTSSKSIQQPVLNGKVDYDSRSVRSSSPLASVEPSNTPHPKSYMEIMAMVQRGEKPSNIRDIDDSPPNPHQQISNPRLIPRSKPWEDSQVQNTATQVLQPHANGKELNYKVQDPSQSNGDTSVPWWQRKNVTIQEIDNGNGYNGVTYAAPSSQQPVQRMWVPPQPPPVAMPEAAEAIRRPKPVLQREQAPDDQPVAHSSDLTDEMQRNQKISESEGATGASSVSSQPSYVEIQEEQ